MCVCDDADALQRTLRKIYTTWPLQGRRSCIMYFWVCVHIIVDKNNTSTTTLLLYSNILKLFVVNYKNVQFSLNCAVFYCVVKSCMYKRTYTYYLLCFIIYIYIIIYVCVYSLLWNVGAWMLATTAELQLTMSVSSLHTALQKLSMSRYLLYLGTSYQHIIAIIHCSINTVICSSTYENLKHNIYLLFIRYIARLGKMIFFNLVWYAPIAKG